MAPTESRATSKRSYATSKRSYRAQAREHRARATRERILAAARSEFLRRGYAATTMRDVVAAAGASAPAVELAFGMARHDACRPARRPRRGHEHPA